MKKLYRFVEECAANNQTILSLTDEQATVFAWLMNEGYGFMLIPVNDDPPEEILVDDWLKTLKRGD